MSKKYSLIEALRGSEVKSFRRTANGYYIDLMVNGRKTTLLIDKYGNDIVAIPNKSLNTHRASYKLEGKNKPDAIRKLLESASVKDPKKLILK